MSEVEPKRRWMSRAGWGLSGLMIAFMLFDSGSKLALESHVVEATTRIGYPLDVIRALGAISLVCTLLYAIRAQRSWARSCSPGIWAAPSPARFGSRTLCSVRSCSASTLV